MPTACYPCVVKRRCLVVRLALTAGWAAGCARPASTAPVGEEAPVIAIQTYKERLSGVRARNPDMALSIGNDPALGEAPVLLVKYPEATADPAGRDVWCDAEVQDWSGGRAISFRIKPDRAIKMSVSFFDRNHVVYTAWVNLQGGVWQPVRVAFDDVRPNPYFQPPDAKAGAPLDVSDVKGIALAPQSGGSGQLALSAFVVTK